MDKELSLVILAAGIGARYGGGVKQLERMGPSGEIIIDYSIYDALEAGFNQVVFIIRRDIEQAFREVIGDRMEAICSARGARVRYAYQDVRALPEGFSCPPERSKPWGTGQALLACKGLLNGPFAVINADDYYGKESFSSVFRYLSQLPADAKGRYCMAGFRLGNTLSENGGVTRGICRVDQQMRLVQVKETKHIVKTSSGAAVKAEESLTPVPVDAYVSMNFWGFTLDVLEVLEEEFQAFLEQNLQVPGSEFLIPVVVDRLLAKQKAAVTVLPTVDRWFGVTYREDAPAVRRDFQKLIEQGVYKSPLFG